jgi:hypothetical protein
MRHVDSSDSGLLNAVNIVPQSRCAQVPASAEIAAPRLLQLQ